MNGTFSHTDTNSSSSSFVEAQGSKKNASSFSRGLPEKSPTKFKWMELVSLLRKDFEMQRLLLTHFELLSVSEARFARAKNVDPRFRRFVADFEAQNCIRAVSVLQDCSQIKKNQYKWMHEGLTLGSAIEALIRELRYLFRSLTKQEKGVQEFLRLLNNWVDYLSVIHRIPQNAEVQLRRLIVERTGLLLNVTLA